MTDESTPPSETDPQEMTGDAIKSDNVTLDKKRKPAHKPRRRPAEPTRIIDEWQAWQSKQPQRKIEE